MNEGDRHMNTGRQKAGGTSRRHPPIPLGGAPASLARPNPNWPNLTTDQRADLIIAMVGDKVLAEARRIRRERGIKKHKDSG